MVATYTDEIYKKGAILVDAGVNAMAEFGIS